MPKRLWIFLAWIAGAAVLTVGVGLFLQQKPQKQTTTSSVLRTTDYALRTSASTNALVTRVIDGDTIDVQEDGTTGNRRIRLLGINTPETVDPRKPVECFGKEASAHMHALVEGRRILLTADPQADERDIYGRELRNLFLEDGTDVNATMVQDGYAYAYLFFPLDPARKRELKKLEYEAKTAERGLWSPVACPR